jgi:hypothetical protein
MERGSNPENKERPNASEKRPPSRPNVARALGKTAIRGANKK